MSLQGAWNAAFGSAINVRKKVVGKSGEIKQSEIQQEAPETPETDIQFKPPRARTAETRVQPMTNEEAAERSQMHLEESDTAENNLNAVVAAMRTRSTRDKFRRRRELRKRREGRMSQNGTTETT